MDRSNKLIQSGADTEETRMADNGPILITGAAGQLGAVGRTVTGLLLERGLPVRAMVRREDERAQALRAAGAEVVVGDLLEPADVYRVVSGCPGSTSACPFRLGTWRRLSPWRRSPGKSG